MSPTLQKTKTKVAELESSKRIKSVALLADRGYFLTSGDDNTIRWWQVEEMEEVGMPRDTGGCVNGIAVARDGKWIIGSSEANVVVFNAESGEKVAELKGHKHKVLVVDMSPDGTKIVSAGSSTESFRRYPSDVGRDRNVRVWSIATGRWHEQFTLDHDNRVQVAKFSHDGCLFATASEQSLRIYGAEQGRLLVDFKIPVSTIAWGHNNNHIFAASVDGHIYHIDALAGIVLSKWRIHTDRPPRCIALASNGSYIAASAGPYISFWDSTSHEQIGSPIEYGDHVEVIAVSSNHDVFAKVGNKIILQNFFDILYHGHAQCMLKLESLNGKIADLEDTVQQLRSELAACRDETGAFTQTLQARSRKRRCEILYAQGRINDALRLLQVFKTSSHKSNTGKTNDMVVDLLADFAHTCIAKLEEKGDEAAMINNHDNSFAAYTAALSFYSPTPTKLLSKWAKIVLFHGSVDKAVVDTSMLQNFDVHQEATEYFQQMQQCSSGCASDYDDPAQWEPDFLQQCGDQLEKLGDTAMDTHRYGEAVDHFSTILSLNPVNRVEILVKRSRAQVSLGSWKNALHDADKIVKLEPSSHRGYEQRHAALHAGGQYTNAFNTFLEMLAKLEQSSGEHIHQLKAQYIDVTTEIQSVINQTVSEMPTVLIDSITGCLCNKAQQRVAFHKLPIYDELRSSMTTHISLNHTRILEEVKKFYRYVMLSHRWEDAGEPLYQTVQNISIYKLQPSSPNIKLKEFSKVAHALGFRWVWSDTCCIDKEDTAVLNASLVAMFRWYRGSALTLVHLCGVQSTSQKSGDLGSSEWSRRGWTYQEYVAAETIQFYTEDWKPYLGLDLPNHKKSPVVIAEMEQVSHISAEELHALEPGPSRVREKLFLASQRLTTVDEDAAYSLLGIFCANTILSNYGEGKCHAVGRLLEYVLTNSGDATILAWTGPAGNYNSCLPADLTVYNQLVPQQIPRGIEPAEMEAIIQELRSSLPQSDILSIKQLFGLLSKLPPPSINYGRLRIAGLAFPIIPGSICVGLKSKNNFRFYRGTTKALGEVEITTKDDLSKVKRPCLFHPWIRTFLDQDFSTHNYHDDLEDKTRQALGLVARVRQPFGALLLTEPSREQYRRIASDSFITVQIRENMPWTDLIDSITTVDVH